MRRSLTNSQVRQILSAVDLRSLFGRRDYLLILFLHETGLQIGECSRLLIRLVSRNGVPFPSLALSPMFCKGSQDRVVPLSPLAQSCIEKMLQFNKEKGLSTSPAAPLFQNSKQCPLSPQAILTLIHRYKAQSGLEIPTTPQVHHLEDYREMASTSHSIKPAHQHLAG